MNKTTSPTLPKIFSNILSDMAFMFVAEPDETAPAAKFTLKTRIGYSGPKSGTLELRCGGRFAAALAANLLGVEPNDSAADQGRLDALKELMNVVCGNFVTELYGADDLFELTIPEVTPVLPDEPDEPDADAEIHRFVAEDVLIELSHKTN
ncbi:MAG: chemotaxis protein CheX [Phycisphaerae bacterium]|nr:chemotaxis protein CheX [Phycisphaerae bacterium]